MPAYDFKCPTCGTLREHVFASLAERDHTAVICRDCCMPMVRQPAAPSFSIHGFTAKNGYSHDA